MRVHASTAVLASTATGDARDEDLVAGCEVGDTGAGFSDGTHAFMTDDSARLYGGNVTFEDVQVSSADCGVVQFDYCVGGFLKLWLRFVFQGQFSDAIVHEGFHGAGLSWGSWRKSRVGNTLEKL